MFLSKRIWIEILIFILVLVCVVPTAEKTAVGSADSRFEIRASDVNDDDEFDVTVSIVNNPGFFEIKVYLYFNIYSEDIIPVFDRDDEYGEPIVDKLKVLTDRSANIDWRYVQNGGAEDCVWVTATGTLNPVYYTGNITEDGDLFSVKFKVKEGAGKSTDIILKNYRNENTKHISGGSGSDLVEIIDKDIIKKVDFVFPQKLRITEDFDDDGNGGYVGAVTVSFEKNIGEDQQGIIVIAIYDSTGKVVASEAGELKTMFTKGDNIEYFSEIRFKDPGNSCTLKAMCWTSLANMTPLVSPGIKNVW